MLPCAAVAAVDRAGGVVSPVGGDIRARFVGGKATGSSGAATRQATVNLTRSSRMAGSATGQWFGRLFSKPAPLFGRWFPRRRFSGPSAPFSGDEMELLRFGIR